MEQHTKDLLDTYISNKILTDRENAAEAIAALRSDPLYKQLKERLATTPFFKPDPYRFVARLVVNHLILGSAVVWLMRSESWELCILGMALAGFAIVQGNFLAHEVDHGGVTKNKALGTLACQYLMTVLCGYCYTYFRRDHELHHFHCQEEKYDPDTHSNLVSLFERSAYEKKGLARLITRYQTVLIPFMYLLWGLDSKCESMAYTLRNPGKTRLDHVGLVLHFTLWFGLGGYYYGPSAAVVNYFGWVVFAGLYLGIIIPVNHVGTTIIRPNQRLSFVAQQVMTSRNIAGPRVMDYLFLGLNQQIEHHLFPWIPATRLRYGREIVRKVCEEHGLSYREVRYSAALREVWSHLRQMAALSPS